MQSTAPPPAPPAPSPAPAPQDSLSVEQRVAQKVLKQTLRLKRGENVIIETWPHTLDLANAFVLEARKLGARPLVHFEDEATYWKSLENVDPKEMGKVGEHEWAALGKANAYVFLWGPADRQRLASMDRKLVMTLHAYNHEWYARAKRAKLRGARMEIARATESGARHYNLALGPWQQELIEATLVDPTSMAKEGKRVATALQRGKSVTIDHPNGTHIELRLRGKRPQIEDGIVGPEDVAAGNNMTSVPSGWVAAPLDERFAEGTFRANRTSFLPAHRADGGEWTFEKGRLVKFAYRSGEDAFSTPYGKAPKKGRDQVGYISIGLNPKIANCPQLEDQERGVVCLSVGRNDELGGTNRVPFISWIALGGADVTVDGHPVLKGGNIV